MKRLHGIFTVSLLSIMVLAVFGSGGLIILILFLALAFVFGYFLGGRDGKIRSVLGLGTAQRNLSAALVIATANFAGNPDVVVMVLILGLVDLVALLITANLLGSKNTTKLKQVST